MKYDSFWLSRCIKMPLLLIFCLGMTMGCATDTGVRSATPDSQQADVPKQITGIQVLKESDADVVSIQGNTTLSYTSIKQPSPISVILYFPETIVSESIPVASAEAGVIGEITVSQVGGVLTSKIEIALKEDIPYLVQREGNSLKVAFSRNATETSGRVTAPPVREVAIPESGLSLTGARTEATSTLSRTYPVDSSSKAASAKSTGLAWVNRIDFSSEKKGKSTVIVGTTKPVEYRMEKVSPLAVQLRLHRTHISDFRKLPLITTRFESAIDRIRPLQTPAMKNDAVIALDLREAVPYYVEQEGNVIRLHFEASSIPPRPDAPLTTPFVEKIEEKQPSGTIAISPGKSGLSAESSAEPKIVSAETRRSGVYRSDVPKFYTGEKMGIDFFDTDIRNVFRLLADFSGENFAIDKDVQGRVTLAFDKPVPWDQVLDLVLRMNQLDKVQEGGIIRIARLKTLEEEEKSKQQFFEAERKAKEQSLELEPVVTVYIPVNYAKAKEDMLPHVEKMISPGRNDCSITVDDRTNQLIVTDTASKVKQMSAVVHKLDRVTPQVVIEAKIVEVLTDFSRELGIKWDAQWGIMNTDPNAGIGPQPGYDILGGTHGGNASVNFPLLTDRTGVIGFNFMRIAGTPIVINAQLQALETNNKGKILSAPKVLTLDNKEAVIEQGLEIGYLVAATTPNTASSVEFKDAKLILKVIPHITQDNRISMKIDIQKKDVAGFVQGIPTLATKKATTELLVDDGDTLVIGGITKATDSAGGEGVPLLADIPILGYLFGTKKDTKKQEEMLIFLTPKIVQLEQMAAKGSLPLN